MLHIVERCDQMGVVVSYSKPLATFREYGASTHIELAAALHAKNVTCCSAIMTEERLREDLWDDPKHMHITQCLLCSEVEEEARRRMMNSYYSRDDIDRIFQERGYPRKTFNWKADKEREIGFRIEDGLFRAQELALHSEIIGEFKEECQYDYDPETDEEVRLPDAEFERRWAARKMEILYPRVQQEYERVYPYTSAPFDYWDHRNPFQQWFFVEEENAVAWIVGGSGGSSQRYQMGLMAHTFMTLDREYGWSIPTYVFKHDANNRFLFVRKWDNFRAVNRDLVGNYPGDYSAVRSLFRGRLATFDYDDPCRRVIELQGNDAAPSF